MLRRKGHNGGNSLTVSQSYLTGDYIGGQLRVCRIGVRGLAGDSVDGGAGRVVQDGRHLDSGGVGTCNRRQGLGEDREAVHVLVKSGFC